MTFQVIVHAFGASYLRGVNVPANELSEEDDMGTLEAIFKYGQNDFQPRSCPSVSVGDFILLDGDVYEVKEFGFRKLPKVN